MAASRQTADREWPQSSQMTSPQPHSNKRTVLPLHVSRMEMTRLGLEAQVGQNIIRSPSRVLLSERRSESARSIAHYPTTHPAPPVDSSNRATTCSPITQVKASNQNARIAKSGNIQPNG